MPGPDVTVPGAGKLPRRTVLIVAGGAAAVVVFLYIKKRGQAQPAVAVDTTTGSLGDTGGGSYQNQIGRAHV